MNRFRWHTRVTLLLFVCTACSQTPQEQYERYMESGGSYYEEGDFATALIEFKNAARAMPEDAEVYFRLAKTLLALQARSQAVDALRQAVTLDPSHEQASLLLAQVMVQVGAPETLAEAEQILGGMLEGHSENGENSYDSEALFLLAATRARQGATQESARGVEDLLRQALEQTPDHLKSALALARLKLGQGDVDGAERVLIRTVENAAEKSAARTTLGDFYIRQGKNDEANEQFDLALADDPEYVPALVGRGLIQFRSDDKDAAEETFRAVSDIAKGDRRLLYGYVLAVNGKLDEAIAEFEKRVADDPEHRAARTALVAAHRRAGNIEAAAGVLTDRLEAEPGDHQTLLARAQVYLDAVMLDKAEDDLHSLINKDPRMVAARFLLTRVHRARGDLALQQAELERVLKLNVIHLQARLELAQSLLASGSALAAVELLLETPTTQREQPRVQAAMVSAYLGAQDYSAARAVIDKGLEQAPNAQYYQLDGILRELENDPEGARRSYEKALELYPPHVMALQALFANCVRANQLDVGIALIQRHADKYPKVSAIQLAVGRLLQTVARPNLARQTFERTLAANENAIDAKLAIAELDQQQGALDKAQAAITEVLEIAPRNAAALLLQATQHDRRREVDESVAMYYKVLELRPNSVVALNNLAYRTASHYNQVDKGLEYAERAKAIAPNHHAVNDTLGLIYYLKGIYPTAVEYFNEALERNPRNPEAHFHLAMVYAKMGRDSESRQFYDKGMLLAPDIPEAAEAKLTLGL